MARDIELDVIRAFNWGIGNASVLEGLRPISVDGNHVNSVDVISLDSGELLLGELTPWGAGWVGIALTGVLFGCDHWLQEIVAGE